MAFDLAWGMRATAGYTTDPSYQVLCGTEAYPHTYTNGDGYSLNAGWTTLTGNAQDLVSGNDPRIVGDVYSSPSVESIFKIDLGSGSAPGADTYTLDAAFGQPGGAQTVQFEVLDNTTSLIAGGPTALSANHFLDATVADVTATTTWTGSTVSKTFATTTAFIKLNPGGTNANYSMVAHFRLTLQVVAYTLTAEVGTFSLGGQTAGLLWAHILDAAVGVFTLSGQAAVLAAARLVAADAGLFTLDGQEAILATGRVLGAEAGSFSLAGQDAAFARAYAILADAGFFTLDGQDVDFVKLTHYLMTVDAGLFSLAGQGVTLRYSGAAAGQGQMMRRHHHP